MSDEETKTGEQAPPVETNKKGAKKTKAASETLEAVESAPGELVITARRNLQIGGELVERGEPLAQLVLRPGVSLNYLVDAVRNGFASEVPAE